MFPLIHFFNNGFSIAKFDYDILRRDFQQNDPLHKFLHDLPDKNPRVTTSTVKNWLLVSTPLKNMKVSWDAEIPNIWKFIKKNVPNHQPENRIFLGLCSPHWLVRYRIMHYVPIPPWWSQRTPTWNHHVLGERWGHFPTSMVSLPIGSMYGKYANIWIYIYILMVNVTIYSIHGSYGS